MRSNALNQQGEIADLLEQLAAAEAEVEAISSKQLNKAVGAANVAMLLRQAQETIREAEGRFIGLAELSPIPIFIHCEGKFVYTNNATLQAFNCGRPEDLFGRYIWDFVHPEYLALVKERVANLQIGQVQKPVEQKWIRLDGTLMDAEVGAVPVLFHGKPSAQVILRDISKRKRAEENLAHSLALASAALESTTDGILIVDLKGEVVSFNEKFVQMWGMPREILESGRLEEIQNFAQNQLLHPEAFRSRRHEVYPNDEAESFDVLEFKDGRLFERYSHPHLVKKLIVGRVWSFRDITERRKSEEALRRSELRFREIWNHSTDGMRLVNSEGQIIMVNDAFCEMIGKARHEIEGKPLADVYREERRSYITNEHRRRFDNRQVKRYVETELVLWNGKKVWFEIANSFVELGGEQPLLLGIFRDVTFRKQIELRGTAFSKLGERLNSATTKEQAARIIVDVADELLGWDGCSLQLYLDEQNIIQALLNVDLVDGERKDVPPARNNCPPLFYTKKTIEEGPQLILRADPGDAGTDLAPRFGDKSRPSASLMFVPIRHSAKIIGVLTIQSYERNAYDHEDLQTLQALADHCSNALQRLQADEERQHSEKRNAALTKLVRSLSAVETQKEAAKIIVDVADELFGWDACNIDLYFPNEKPVLGVIVIDTIDGKRVSVSPFYNSEKPNPIGKRVMENGPELILRDEPAFAEGMRPFGGSQPSASLMFAPIRHGSKTIGVFTIQSYTRNAYKTEDLATLQALADHCGGTLERLRNAERLQASEQRFQIVSKATNDAIWDWDLVSNELWWNPSFPQLFAYRPEDVDPTLEFWTTRIHPEDRERVVGNLHRQIESGQVIWSDEYRFQRGNGSYADIFDRGYVIRDGSGNPVRMIGVMMDITERKRVEERHIVFSQLGQALSTATTPLAAAQIISESTHQVFKWDAFTMSLYYADKNEVYPILNFDTVNGKRIVTSLSSTVEKPSGRAQRVIKNGGELILKSEQQLSPDAVPFGDVARPSASIIVVPIRNKDAVLGILSVQSYAMKAYDQRDLQALQTLADHCGGALERIRAEQALRSSEVRFHSIWENSVDGMRLTDENGTIIAVNEAYCRMVGAPREDLEGKPFCIVYAETQNQFEVLEKYRARFQQREIEKTLTRRLTFRNGKTVDLEDTNSFIEVPGQKPLLLALFRDITQQKRLEDELRHSQKMESVGQLAGGIAHDFNNILTVIQGHSSLLQLDRMLTPKTRESIQQISHVADRAANLTRQLLTFSRKQVIQPKNLDLNEIVSNMTKLLQRVLGEDISLQVSFNSKLPIIRADPGMIEQILMNLAVNSRDAMPRGGKLFVQTSSIELTASVLPSDCKPGRYVCLKVRDTGCGIPKEIQPRVFEPFFTTKDVGKGTGLGLATVYGIVKQHQGWLEMQSEVGVGTTFKIYLPAVVAKEDMPETKLTPQKMTGGKETILLVEDEVEVRNLAKLILQRLGYKLFEAPSGVGAIAIWQREKDNIDLVLTDMVMPDGMTGRELADKLQSDKPSLKVVFCSGYSTEMVGHDSILQEGINFLQKPYTPQKLAKIVRDRLDQKSGD